MTNKTHMVGRRAPANDNINISSKISSHNNSEELNEILDKQDKKHNRHMRSIIKPIELRTFKAYPFIIAMMAVLQVLCTIYARYFIDFLGFQVPLGTLVVTPVILYIFQVVAECYGWQYARQIVWCNFAVNLIFTIATYLSRYVPISVFTHTNLKDSYVALLHTMWVSSLMLCITIFIADYVATVLMARIKLLTKSRFLLMRLIMIHCITEAILVSGGFITMPYNGYSFHDTLHLIYGVFISRTIVSFVLLPFSGFVIWYIQDKVEQVVAFDTGRDSWNIFHWNIDHKNTVQFSAKDWSRLSAEKKKRVDISKIALDYYDDDKLGIDKIFKNKNKS